MPLRPDMMTVHRVAWAAGVGLRGVRIELDLREELRGRGVFGFALPDGSGFQLFLDAFESVETLAATLGHERMHVYQHTVFGAPVDSLQVRAFEAAANLAELDFLDYLDRHR